MSVRSEVLLWAQRVVARPPGTAPHLLLEIKSDASIDDAQDAFHQIARTGHPDLHRASLTAEELELVTTAYARVAGAYQDYRSKHVQTVRMRPPRDDAAAPRPPSSDRMAPLRAEGTPPAQRPARPDAGDRVPTQPATPSTVSPRSPSPSQSAPGAPGPMNNRALIYYRKAELCLRKGDLKGAVLNMKMAIAGDPQSAFLRTALAEIEAELAK